MKISAVVLAKNEEKFLDACLQSLQWCDEIIVIDDNSTDNTKDIAKKYHAIIFTKGLDGDFTKQRNFGFEKAKGEWVLFVDADERVTTSLRDEIIQYTNNPINESIGFYLKREDHMWGKVLRHGEQGSGTFLRLVRKGKGKWKGTVHEVMEVSGLTKTLQHPLQHFPHPTLAEFLQDINFYSNLRAEELYKKGVRATWLDVLLYPKAKFIQNYIWKMGFLDGMEGFITAILMSFHSFLVRGTLWQLTRK